jgi:hypothetical protein
MRVMKMPVIAMITPMNVTMVSFDQGNEFGVGMAGAGVLVGAGDGNIYMLRRSRVSS